VVKPNLRPVEISDLLGVSHQRASKIAGERGFPKPIGREGQKRLWDRREVAAWAKVWKRALLNGERRTHSLRVVRLLLLFVVDVADEDVVSSVEINRQTLGLADGDILDLVNDLHAFARLVDRAGFVCRQLGGA
jgi:hypothetical protein